MFAESLTPDPGIREHNRGRSAPVENGRSLRLLPPFRHGYLDSGKELVQARATKALQIMLPFGSFLDRHVACDPVERNVRLRPAKLPKCSSRGVGSSSHASGGGEHAVSAKQIATALEHSVARLDPKPGEAILDLATGTGWTSRLIARRGVDVIGVDIASELLAAATERARKEGLKINYQIGDAEKLPFADRAFDGVISTFGVMFASRPEAAAAELARVCRRGGRIALATWQPDSSVFMMSQIMRPFMPPPALASDRTSCRSPLANQMRLILHTAAYWLMLTTRDAIPTAHTLAKAEFATLRLRLLKLGARVIETASRVRLAFTAACPDAAIIRQLATTIIPAAP